MNRRKEEPNLSGITLGGEPLSQVIDEVDTTPPDDVTVARKEEQTKHKHYRRPAMKNSEKKDRSGKTRMLTQAEKNVEYFDTYAKALHASNAPVSKKMLLTLLATKYPETWSHLYDVTKEAIGQNPCPKSTWSSTYSGRWKNSPIFYLMDYRHEDVKNRKTKYGLQPKVKVFSVDYLYPLTLVSGWKTLHVFFEDHPELIKHFPEDVLVKHAVELPTVGEPTEEVGAEDVENWTEEDALAETLEYEHAEEDGRDFEDSSCHDDTPPIESYADLFFEDQPISLEDAVSAIRIYADSIGMDVEIDLRFSDKKRG